MMIWTWLSELCFLACFLIWLFGLAWGVWLKFVWVEILYLLEGKQGLSMGGFDNCILYLHFMCVLARIMSVLVWKRSVRSNYCLGIVLVCFWMCFDRFLSKRRTLGYRDASLSIFKHIFTIWMRMSPFKVSKGSPRHVDRWARGQERRPGPEHWRKGGKMPQQRRARSGRAV